MCCSYSYGLLLYSQEVCSVAAPLNPASELSPPPLLGPCASTAPYRHHICQLLRLVFLPCLALLQAAFGVCMGRRHMAAAWHVSGGTASCMQVMTDSQLQVTRRLGLVLEKQNYLQHEQCEHAHYMQLSCNSMAQHSCHNFLGLLYVHPRLLVAQQDGYCQFCHGRDGLTRT